MTKHITGTRQEWLAKRLDLLMGTYHFLDLAPLGRNEDVLESLRRGGAGTTSTTSRVDDLRASAYASAGNTVNVTVHCVNLPTAQFP